jgi:hypothetical protein
LKFVTEVTLVAQASVNYTPDVVEELVDAFHDLDYVEEVDASGSLASRDLEVQLIVEADDIDEAQAAATRAVRDALASVGGSVVGQKSSSPDFRKTSASTRELAPA